MIHSEKHEYRFNNTEIKEIVWYYLKANDWNIPEHCADIHIEGEPELLVAYYYADLKK